MTWEKLKIEKGVPLVLYLWGNNYELYYRRGKFKYFRNPDGDKVRLEMR